jgi:trafficking protein particle complex subunit 9
VVLYDLTLSGPPASHLTLSPFELFREPLIVLGIADAQEYYYFDDQHELNTHDARAREFLSLVDSLRDEYPRVLLHRVLLFDNSDLETESKVQDSLIMVPPAEKIKPTTMKAITCDLTASILTEFTSFSKSIQALPSIASPMVTQPSSTHAQWHGDEPPSLSRASSYSSDRSRSSSPALGPRETNRMSMPVLPSSLSNVTSESSVRMDSPNGFKSPAKTFEEIANHEPSMAGIGGPVGLRPRPGSIAISRDASQERVSVHGFVFD